MGTLTAQAIVDRARHILQDNASGGTRWLDPELLKWVNDAQREIVLLKPNAYSAVEDVNLVSGTRQTLPAEGLLLLSIVRNTGGDAVRRVDRNIMDSENAHWHNEATDPVVEHYVFDEDAPDTFWVYPPNSGGGSVEIIYSRAPSDLTDLSDTIVLNDIYSNVIVDYILYRAYSKDTDYAGNQERAASHYQAFNGSLGIKLKAEQSSSPNMNPQTLRAAQ